MTPEEKIQIETTRAELSAANQNLSAICDVIRHDRIGMRIVEEGFVDYDYIAQELIKHQLLEEDEPVIEKLSFLLSEEVANQEEATKARDFLKKLIDAHFSFNFYQRFDEPGFEIK